MVLINAWRHSHTTRVAQGNLRHSFIHIIITHAGRLVD